MADISSITLPDGNTYNFKDSTSGYITGMEILSYGSSTWADFLAAYNAKKVVYCRASSNANPASGSQTRLAFMAYVNNATNPTSVEFQYYRSVSSHSANQQGDQVYVYSLTSANKWTVTVRESYTKVVAGSGLTSSYANSAITLSTVHTIGTDVPANAVFTDTTYSAGSNITLNDTEFSLTKANVTGALGYTPPEQDTTYSAATTSVDGLMSSTDKSKLDGISSSYDSTTETLTITL